MTSQISRMGHCSALGVLPNFMLKVHIDSVINALLNSIEITAPTLKWSESRRDAIKALTNICCTLKNEVGTGEYFCYWRNYLRVNIYFFNEFQFSLKNIYTKYIMLALKPSMNTPRITEVILELGFEKLL